MNKQKIKQYQKEYRNTHKKEAKNYWKNYSQLKKKQISARMKKWYLKNKERILKEKINYYANNKEKILVKCKIYRDKDKNKRLEQLANYRKTHKKQIAEYNKIYCKNHKIIINLRRRLHKAIKGVCKSKSTLDLLGCSIEQLKRHLESKFKSGMSWDNYGEWHIDHIIPCAQFDLNKESEQIECFNWKNLQPLWAEENLIKNRFMEV